MREKEGQVGLGEGVEGMRNGRSSLEVAAGGREEGQLSTLIGNCCGVVCSTRKICWVGKLDFCGAKRRFRETNARVLDC